jgi:hypothetical protein
LILAAIDIGSNAARLLISEVVKEGDKYKAFDEFSTVKKFMKSTDVGDYIHAIKFNVNNTHDLELVFVLKRDFWSRYSNVRDAARYYLDSLGYNKVTIHVP